MNQWITVIDVVRDTNDEGQDVNGIAVYLQDSDDRESRQEVGRVAFYRPASTRPRMAFEDALLDMVARAEKAAEVANDLLDDAERARAERQMQARDKIKGILGDRDLTPA